MNAIEICVKYGHDWVIHSGVFWSTAECLTCGRKIRDVTFRYRDLPNPRREGCKFKEADNE